MGYLRFEYRFIESYLVCNDKDSNTGKSKDAKALNIPIITEEEYIQKFFRTKIIKKKSRFFYINCFPNFLEYFKKYLHFIKNFDIINM